MSELFLFSKSQIYREIIEALGKWKILECRDLYKTIDMKISYETLKRRVRFLEQQGLLESKFSNNCLKYVYLTDLGIRYTSQDQTFSPKEEEISHDIICSKVVQEFLKFSNVVEAKMYHQISTAYINPDAELIIQKENSYKMALEIELTQKSQKRIKNKFEKYSDHKDFDYCVFITNKKRIIETYSRYLREMNKSFQENFFFILCDNLLDKKPVLDSIQCFHLEEVVSLNKIFGEKIEVVPKGVAARSQNLKDQKTQYF
tara:strand:+ start:2484 stop:3260 length:777 start_codon:yes stop_codon:yes gene_type:complete